MPAPGNHDLPNTPAVVADYFGYFSAAAADPPSASTHTPWHLACHRPEQQLLGRRRGARGFRSGLWLRNGLVASAGMNVLAYWHHPLLLVEGCSWQPGWPSRPSGRRSMKPAPTWSWRVTTIGTSDSVHRMLRGRVIRCTGSGSSWWVPAAWASPPAEHWPRTASSGVGGLRRARVTLRNQLVCVAVRPCCRWSVHRCRSGADACGAPAPT